jgi:hypothetical protein
MTFEIKSSFAFNADAAWKDLFERLTALSHEWGQILRDTMDANRQFYFDFDMDYEVRDEISRLVVDIFPAGDMAWEAWLEEFGKGSMMAEDNPYIGEYRNSAYWNSLRSGNTVVGREAGDYLGLDGKQHTSTGGMAGLDLEQYSATTGDLEYAPSPPTYFIRDAIQSNQLAIYESLQQVVADWGSTLARFFTF